MTPLQRIAAVSSAVALISGGVGASISSAIANGRAIQFPRCGQLDTLSKIRGLKFHAAQLAGDSVYVVPMTLDSAGTPTLDTALKALVTDSSLAWICTVPGTPPGQTTQTTTPAPDTAK